MYHRYNKDRIGGESSPALVFTNKSRRTFRVPTNNYNNNWYLFIFFLTRISRYPPDTRLLYQTVSDRKQNRRFPRNKNSLALSRAYDRASPSNTRGPVDNIIIHYSRSSRCRAGYNVTVIVLYGRRIRIASGMCRGILFVYTYETIVMDYYDTAAQNEMICFLRRERIKTHTRAV